MPVPFNPKKLAAAVNAGYKSLSNFRASTRWALQQYVGSRYGKDPASLGKETAAIVNLLNQAVGVLLPNLVLMNPKTDIVARRIALSQQAKKLALAVDQVAEDQNLAEVYELVAQGALLAPTGIARVYVRQGVEEVITEDGETPTTTVGVDPIDFEDYFMDADARRIYTARIDGHRWTGSREVLDASGLFENLDQVSPLGSGDNPESRMNSGNGDRWTLMEAVPLVHVAVYGANSTRIVILAGCKPGDENIADPNGIVVHDYEFEGLERGPYRHLFFNPLIGDNPMPLPPADVWGDLHDAMIRIAGKIVRQILRTKKITASKRGQGGDDLEAVRVAQDGEHLELDDPSSIVGIEQGGVIKDLYEGVAFLMQGFENAGPNISLMGGTPGAEEESATKTSILASRGSLRLQFMQNKAFKFAAEVAKAMAFYIDTDPLMVAMPIPVRVGRDDHVQITYRPNGPDRSWPGNYNFAIKQFSMVPMDPAIRSRRITEILQTIPGLVPLEQLYPGVTSRALELQAKEIGSEELAEVLQDPAMLAQQEATLGAVPMQAMGVPAQATAQGMGGAVAAMPGPGGANPQLNVQRSAMSPAQMGV